MTIDHDRFNSDIFNIRMGNVRLDADKLVAQNSAARDVIEQARSERFDHISVKVPTSHKTVVNCFVHNGFYLTDTLVEYVYKFDGRAMPSIMHRTILRDYKEDDLDGLMTIAKGSFEYDRYHSDPTLDNSLCDRYYEQWIYNSCHGFADKVIVSEFNHEVVGFTTGKADHEQEYGRLVLSAVSNKYRGLGIYTSMIYEGVKWLETEGFKGLIVGTQINNVAVQKAWIKLGFTVLDSEYVLQLHL